MSNEAPTIDSLSDLEETSIIAGVTLDDPSGYNIWWRGHADLDWKLVPSAYRHHSGLPSEILSYRIFKKKAPTRCAKVPAPTDHAGWFYLMQHYRLPTRLLDWTESLLVALFFVVDDIANHHKDGMLIALNPRTLNGTQVDNPRVGTADFPAAQELLAEPFTVRYIKDLPPEQERKIVAFTPDEIDQRMMVQQSAFTVHGHLRPIEALPSSDKFLSFFRVPAARKVAILQSLFKIGIRRSTLFPDLENLASEIKLMKIT